MAGMDGFETCQRLKQDPATVAIPVLFITARTETADVVEGFGIGGSDYIAKPFRTEEVLARVQTHLERTFLQRALVERNGELAQKNEELQRAIDQHRILNGQKQQLSDQLSMLSQREAEHWGIPGFVGKSPLLQKVLRDIQLLQNSSQTSVLISGESGTGKELVARALHFGSERAGGPFVPINCSAVPADLAESQFFGHVKGAFTGADANRKGHFKLAHGGTLFLDEVGDMPPDLQAKLLRVLEDGVIVPLGGAARPVDVRVLSATNTDLQAAVGAGTFRQDLYFRLASFPVAVPPLRQRPEDIPLLVEHFLALFAGQIGQEQPAPTAAALERLQGYAFPGNIRELKNIVERALIESGGEPIGPEHLHFFHIASGAAAAVGGAAPDEPLPLNLDQAEKVLMRRALEQTGNNIAATARLLGTNRQRIYRFLRGEEE